MGGQSLAWGVSERVAGTIKRGYQAWAKEGIHIIDKGVMMVGDWLHKEGFVKYENVKDNEIRFYC